MIDYGLLAKAITMYERLDYTYVDAPWTVPQVLEKATNNSENAPYFLDHNCLVGSAEQSILYLFAQRKIQKGRYVACTPCFRRESITTNLRRKYFMKVELFDSRDTACMHALLYDAWTVMKELGKPVDYEVEAVKTEEGFDLDINGIEVGSYGIREAVIGTTNYRWAYGTGLALPRFTQAVSQNY